MRFPRSLTVLAVVLLLVVPAQRLRADALAELEAFSVFKQVDLEKLASGEIMTARGRVPENARDLAVESCYLVAASLAKTAEMHRQWDATRHSELKVYLHGDVGAKPSANDFQRLDNLPGNSAVRALLAATAKLPEHAELQMNNAEAQAFASGGSAGAFWRELLLHRAVAMSESGIAKQPAYNVGTQTIRPADEVNRLLGEQPKISAQFRSLIAASGIAGGGGSLKPALYWELFDVEGQAAFTLGAAYEKGSAESAQSLDLQYYASGGYYALLTFYQMWPVTAGGQPATLVWRGDSISSASLGELHGVERMGSGAAMMKEIKKSINLFRKDTGK